eukprot:CAMPEP_0170515384 /NCGR_PEP_ID=MMETSP0209-20121228/1825_1 /TAXON_ID=665100 ORGANISM="Litonotus pictus, Strain P1" /NCGR_SAMPLE_ID=MMETSP0209 /ASSEMBLY_ACC=CAM_ASM_000301 /LENGTH=276 /DNA_ID=CAMNT_0010799843 /DNA_START=126 /DNA_END=956 /DNA_ORIENTATION=+
MDFPHIKDQVNYAECDVSDKNKLEYIIKKEGITYVIHLAGILSALAEREPELAKKVNVDSIHYLFRLSIKYKLSLFIPSTIGVFGPDSPKTNVPLRGVINPIGKYGVTKLFMENLGNYYKNFYNVDFRSVRYVGVISPEEFAYNGSTDYATEIFFRAQDSESYDVCLSKDRRLPMSYVDDIMDGTIKLIEAPKEKLLESTYNMNCCNFTPQEMAEEIKRYYPRLKVGYKPDIRDQISSTWPYHYDDSASRRDWGWNPKYDTLEKIAKIMYEKTTRI